MFSKKYWKVVCRPALSLRTLLVFVHQTKGDLDMIQAVKSRFSTTVLVTVGMAGLVNLSSRVTGSQGGLQAAEEHAATQKHAEDLTARFGAFYQPVVVISRFRTRC